MKLLGSRQLLTDKYLGLLLQLNWSNARPFAVSRLHGLPKGKSEDTPLRSSQGLFVIPAGRQGKIRKIFSFCPEIRNCFGGKSTFFPSTFGHPRIIKKLDLGLAYGN